MMENKSGWHIYCVVKGGINLKDMKQIQENILIRAWNNGLGFIKISKTGTPLKRCPVDLSVLSPERLIFESEPILSDDLEKNKIDAVYIDGGYLL